MGFIAIAGCGALGGAVAHKLAGRDRVAEVRLIDPEGAVARGKALDIRQSAPIEQFATRISAADSWAAAAGADVIVIADQAGSGAEHEGEPGLAMLRQLTAAGVSSPLVFAGARQRELMARVVSELRVPRTRVLGSAPFALESAIRAVAAVMLDGSGLDLSLRVIGVPPHGAVVAWEGAAAAGLPLASQLPPHAIASVNARIPSLWPPGPYALGSAAAQIVEGIVHRSRRQFSAFVVLERGPLREAVVAMPVNLRPEGISRVLEPSLTSQEQTKLENALDR